MTEDEDKIIKNIILNNALHDYKLKKERELKRKMKTHPQSKLGQLKKVIKHIDELQRLE